MLTATLARRPAARPVFPQGNILTAIAERRASLARLEEGYVAACEEAACRGAPAHVRREDRDTWDHAMWDRYMSAAAALEPTYGPRMRRLYEEIDRLGRVADIPRAA